MNTQIWIQLDGRQQGPFSLEQLSAMGIRPDTPVWYKGLADWTIACNAPLTAGLFSAQAQSQPQNRTYASGGYNVHPPFGNVQQPMPPCPPTYIAWSIIVTICCCLPFGIVSIVYSSQVSSRYIAGDYEGALRASERAQLWMILSIVCGLISAPFAYLFGVF